MKLSCFCPAALLSQAGKAGFDDVEPDICEINAMSAAQFEAYQSEARAAGFAMEVFSDVIPLTERFHSPQFDLAFWLEHVKRGAERTASLGARRWTFGAGKCRSIPEDCPDRAAAVRRVEKIVGAICDVLLPYGITLLVEPLGPANSNFLGTIDETADFVRRIGRNNLSAMCDLRHMVKREEPFTEIIRCREWIGHAHIDNPAGTARLFPQAGDGYEGYEEYIRALKEAGYDGILAIEATQYGDFLSEARESVRYLRTLLTD